MKAILRYFLLVSVSAWGGQSIAHEGHSDSVQLVVSKAGPVENRASITIDGNYRVIRANGIPDHTIGAFPNRYNPNSIAPQDYTFRVPVNAVVAARPTSLGMHPFGVALNGVVFDPAAAEWWNRDRQSGWQYEPMLMVGRLGADESNGHVQPTGTYHYHSVPTALVNKLSGGKAAMTQVGWAADGFPIYGSWSYANPMNSKSLLKQLKSSYRIKKGVRPNGPGGNHDGTFVADYEYVKGAGDLDECNGRFGVTPEFPEGTYYYVLTEDFPFIPRQFKGTPDSSFFRKGPPGGPRRQGPGVNRPDHQTNLVPTGEQQQTTLQNVARLPERVTSAN